MGIFLQLLNLRFDRFQIAINSGDESPVSVNQHAGRDAAAAESIKDGLIFIRQQGIRHVVLVAERF